MHLHEVEGDGWVGEADPQDRLVARGAAAQVAQPHLAARDSDLLLQSLDRQMTQQAAVRDSREQGRRQAPSTLGDRQAEEEAEREDGGERRSRNSEREEREERGGRV